MVRYHVVWTEIQAIKQFDSIHVLEKDYLTRSCHCRIRDVACLEW
jgi:hypothetical protein